MAQETAIENTAADAGLAAERLAQTTPPPPAPAAAPSGGRDLPAFPPEAMISLKDLGAVGDGQTDDTAAFVKAREMFRETLRDDPRVKDGRKVGSLKFYLPPGDYLITEPEAILDRSFTQKTFGLVFEGAGASVTHLLYRPRRPGPLIYNNDAVLYFRFNRMRVYGDDPQSDFMYSESHGFAQDYGFDDVTWGGRWRYGFHLKGTNNNSEFKWWGGAGIGQWDSFLWSEDNDQFLNYWFYSFKWHASSRFLRMDKGGHVKLFAPDISGYRPDKPTWLFELNNASHWEGVQSFVIYGGRIELHNANAKVLRSEWGGGLIGFDDVDLSSQSWKDYASGMTAFEFVSKSSAMPTVSFRNCHFMGKTRFQFLSQSWDRPARIRYENCGWKNYRRPDEAFVFDNGGNQAGGVPVVNLVGCRSTASGADPIWDTDLNWSANRVGQTRRKFVSLRGADGRFVWGGRKELIKLPPGCLVIEVQLLAAPGHVDYRGRGRVSLRAQSGEVLAEAAVDDWSRGFAVKRDVTHLCRDDAARTLVLSDDSGVPKGSEQALCLIAYIG